MEQYYHAIDIGASSGRHILGHMEDGKMVLEEIYRFPNGMTEENGQRCWNVKALFRAILEGMKKCKKAGKSPVSMGIQKQIFNTIYQLMAVKSNNPEILEHAETMLMIPEYFNYLLTGEKASEYTNATTTQLVSPETKDWDYELIEML